MPVQIHHSHSETHNGFVPEDQLADGTPTAGFVPTATGTGEAVWGEVSGGATPSTCDHRHITERFVAAGATPETFTLFTAPLFDVRVHLQGVRADPNDMTVTGADVELDTTTDNVVLIDYEGACESLPGGVIYDGLNPGDPGAINWYYVMPASDFAALTPGAWTPDTLYIAGALIAEDGSYFVRVPTPFLSRVSDSVGNEPDWTTTVAGDFILDLSGYWVRLPDLFDITDPLPSWVADTYLGIGGSDSNLAYLITANGHIYVADTTKQTAAVDAPLFPIDPCAGLDKFYVGDNSNTDPATFALARAYVAASVSATLNGSPVTPTEDDPDTAMVSFDGSTWDLEDILIVTYEAVCP